MTFDYGSIYNTAVAQINDKGRDFTYRAFTSGTYNPATGAVAGDSNADVTIKGVFTNIIVTKIDETALQRGDKFLLIAADVVTPNEKDAIIDGTDIYQVVNVATVQPGGTKLLYKLQVRK